MIINRLNREQMVEQMESSLNRLRAKLEWNGQQQINDSPPSQSSRPASSSKRPEPSQTRPEPKPFVCDIQMHQDTVDTLVALGVKRSLAQELDVDAKGQTVGDRVAYALRHSK